MSIIFGNWKYRVVSFWFVLPFAVLPALFLALSLDYTAIRSVLDAFFSGDPSADFMLLFRTWSLIRVDSWLGAVYSVLAVACFAVCMAVLLSLVEKHMRIGKRTLSGAFSQLGNNLINALLITVLYLAMYELWAALTAAVLYMIGGIVDVTVGVYVLMIFALACLLFVLVYCAAVFYLWFPCLQHTGFSRYEGLRYSYQLMCNVRGKLILSLLISLVGFCLLIALCAAVLPEYFFYIAAFLFLIILFSSFCVRMETIYFAVDRLDREDIIRSWRDL